VIARASDGAGIDAILIPGGFGVRGSEGKIQAAGYARTKMIPFLGICLGLQMAVIEYARNVTGIDEATSREFKSDSKCAVIDIMESQKQVAQLGGSMRLGAYHCELKKDTLTRKMYGQKEISERHRHRFEFNNNFREKLEKSGLVISGVWPEGDLVEIIELKDHPWFIGVQFHPEFKSTPRNAHPLFKGFISAALKFRDQRNKGKGAAASTKNGETPSTNGKGLKSAGLHDDPRQLSITEI